MKTARTTVILSFLLAGGLLAACDDPTNVGADLVGAQGGQPEPVEIPASALSSSDLIRPANLAPRVIAGRVDDPGLGTYMVQGYFDITPVTDEEFRSGDVDSVALRLAPTYVYGDTTGEVTLALREITEAWDPDGLPTDTSFSVGPVIREFSLLPTDTLVVVALPDDWVEEHDEVIRSTDFGSLFHGFRLDPVSGNAVVGFGPSESSFFASTGEETSASPLGISYPYVERTNPVDPPANRILMQAGSGPAISFTLPLSDTLTGSAVNRATLTMWIDSVSVEDTPENFARPTLRMLDLFGITSDGSSALLARSSLNDEAQFVFETPTLAGAMQGEILESRSYVRYELRIPNPNTVTTNEGDVLFHYTSLNPMLFHTDGAGDTAPAMNLTLTPLD